MTNSLIHIMHFNNLSTTTRMIVLLLTRLQKIYNKHHVGAYIILQ